MTILFMYKRYMPVIVSWFGLLSPTCTLAATSVNGIRAGMACEGQHFAHLPACSPMLVALRLQFLAEFLE